MPTIILALMSESQVFPGKRRKTCCQRSRSFQLTSYKKLLSGAKHICTNNHHQHCWEHQLSAVRLTVHSIVHCKASDNAKPSKQSLNHRSSPGFEPLEEFPIQSGELLASQVSMNFSPSAFLERSPFLLRYFCNSHMFFSFCVFIYTSIPVMCIISSA